MSRPPTESRPPAETTLLELVASRVLPTAVRGRAVGEGPITYRRALDDIIPGHLLSVEERHRWRFRKTVMVGGPLQHVSFSLRALRTAGFALPAREGPNAISDPADGDPRLLEGLLALAEEDWLGARCELLDVAEDEPGSPGAHCGLGHVHAALSQTVLALAHYTAAVRLGLAAMGTAATELDPTRPGANALLGALRGRARLLERLGRPEAAAADLRRALRCNPGDDIGAGRALARLEQARG